MFFKTVLVFFLLRLSYQYGSIDYHSPTKVSVLNYGLTSIYTFNLNFQTSLPANNYLMINFTNYTTTLSPVSCYYSIFPNFPSSITTCLVSNSDNVVVVLMPISILNTNTYTFVIELANTNPISSLGSALELKSVSSTDFTSYFVYDFNPNFDLIPYDVACSNVMSTSLYGFDQTSGYNLPSQQVAIYVSVKINVNVFDNPRIKLVLTNPWSFRSTTILSVSNDPKYISLLANDTTKSDFKAPVLQSFKIESPLEAYLVFSENLLKGRSFLINIASFVNPSTYSTIFLKIYSMNYNSNSAFEVSLSSIQLQTLQNPLTVKLGLASQIPLNPNTPGSFYKNTKQYIQINITSSNPTPDNSYLTIIVGKTNKIIQGSASIYGISQFNSSLPIGLTYSGNTLQISNIKSIAKNLQITVTMRITTSAVDSYICANASFDMSSTSSTPSFAGSSSIYYFLSNAYTIISSFTLSMNPTNSLSFTITPSADDTNLNSFLEIYFSQFIKFSGSPICSINIPAFSITTNLACTLVTYGTYNYLKVVSATGTNSFPSNGETLTVTGFSLTDCSNQQDKLYEFYMALNYDNSATPIQLLLMITALALPTRNTLSNFYQSISNDLTWTTFTYNYPSIINLVGSASVFSSITIPSGSQSVISVFAYKGFQNLFGTNLVSNTSYPCSSNLKITCIYVQGDTQSSLSGSYFLDWDRVHIFLPSTITQDFHIVLPDIFIITSYLYEIYVGTVSATNQFSYSYLENQLTLLPTNVLSSSFLNSNLQIQNSGFAAAEISNFKVTIYTSTSQLGNLSPDFGAALFIVTNWELWISGTSSVASGTAFGTLQNSPLNFDFYGGDNMHYYVVYLPLTNPSNLNAGLVSYLNGVFNPFSLDLPNYVMYVTSKSGTFDSYNAFFNAGTNSYSSNTLKTLNFKCIDLLEGELNTFCSFTFQTNNRISSDGNFLIQATGLTFNTNTCWLSYTNNDATVVTLSQFSCGALDSGKTLMNVNLNMPSDISVVNIAYFNISLYGIDINTQGTGSISINFSVRDFSSNYIIESLTKSFSVLPKLLRFSTISSINLEYYNPNAITQINVTVTFPRNIYPNENIGLDLGSSLYETNQNPEVIEVQLYNSVTQLSYPVSIQFFGSLFLLSLMNTADSITAGSYFFDIKGVSLPSKTPNSTLVVVYMRTYDEMITISSYDNSSASFPNLLGNDKPNIQILESKYVLEGHVAEYIFGVTILSSSLDYQTIMYLNFPGYYSPSLYKAISLLYCGINSLSLNCSNDPLFPYRLKITNFPIFLYQGSSFNITVYGIDTPKYSNQNSAEYMNSTLVFGVDQFKNGSFSEIANLIVPSIIPLMNPFNYLQLSMLVVENPLSNDFSYYHFELLLENIAISINSGFLLHFGEEYTYLKNLESIQCSVSYLNADGSTNVISDQNSCSVRGNRVKGFFYSSLAASTKFNITLLGVPNPACLCTIDPNLMLISIFDSSDSQIISYTKDKMSYAFPVTFTAKTQDIELNNGNAILLTQGTYTPKILIAPSNTLRFLNYMSLNVLLDGFEFMPSNLYVTLGDFSTGFQIGVERDLFNGVYSFDFQKIEYGLIDIYNNLSAVYVFLTTNPIQIDIPNELIVNYYGCNLPYIVNLTYPPFTNLTMEFMLDYDTFQDSFFVDDELNSYSSIFMQNNTVSNLVFCTNDQIDTTITSTVIYLTLSGINSDSYYLSSNQINIVFQNKSRINPPSINSTVNYVGRTWVSISLSVSADGLVFYRLVNTDYNQKNLTANETLNFMQSSNFSFWINSSNTAQVGVYEIMNYMIVHNNTNTTDLTVNNSLIINGLLPSTEYEFFAYARNEFRDMSNNFTYQRFKTQELRNLSKVLVIYNRSLYRDEINEFYCDIVRSFQTKAYLVVSSDGNSCSYGFSPNSSYFNYTGQTFSDSSNRTNLYFIPDTDLENDPTHDLLVQNYDPTTMLFNTDILNQSYNTLVDYLNQMIFIESFNQTLLYTAQAPFIIPALLNVSFGVFDTKYNNTIIVSNLTLSGDGVVYFIMDPYLDTLEDSEFPGDYYNQTIKTYQKPTGDQIRDCKNYLNQTASVCFRATYYNSTSYNIQVRGLLGYTVYKVYYMIANENPIFPVYNNSQVYETEALSYTIFGNRLGFWSYLVALLLIGLLVSLE